MTGMLVRPVVCPIAIGREAEIAALREQLQRSRRGGGQAVLVSGDAGVGKSRLLDEAAAFAAELGYQVVRAACFETGTTAPYAPFAELLLSRFAAQPPDAVAAALGQSAALLSPLISELLAQPPEGTAALPGRPEPRSTVPDPSQQQRRRLAAITSFFLREAAARPCCIVVEDLHWCDDSSLECLFHLARRLREQPLVLLLSYRSDEAGSQLRHWRSQLNRERLAAEIALSGLSRADVDAMLRAMFALDRPVPADFLDALYRLTEGNPYFIEEVMTSLLASGAAVTAGGSWQPRTLRELNIPPSVHDAVRQRTERLDDAARALLRLAAVIGRRFSWTLLHALTGYEEPQLLALLKLLIAAGLVVEESAEQFAFRHALTREAIQAQLLARERRRLHASVAEAIERKYATVLDSRLPELADHYFHAGVWDKALAYGRRAGEAAMALYAPRAAIEQFGYALEAAAQLELAPPLDVLRRRGQARDWVGDWEGARRDYSAALDLAHAAPDREAEWQTMLDLGLLWAGRDYHQSREWYGRALELARTLDQPQLLAQSLNRLGNWYANADRPREGQRYHREALAVFEQLGDRRGYAATLDLLAIAAGMSGALSQMVAYCGEATRLFEELDNRQGLSSALGTLVLGGGILHSCTVAAVLPPAEAIGYGERALGIVREIGWRAGEAYTQSVLGSHLATLGEYGRALELPRSALDIATEIDHRAWITQAHQVYGGVLLELLLVPAALEHLERALALARQHSSLYRLHVVAGQTAAAYIAAGRHEQAEQLLDSVKDEQTPTETLGRRLCWMARAELLLARDDAGAALSIVDRLLGVAPAAQASIPRLALLRGTALSAIGMAGEAEAVLLAARDAATARGSFRCCGARTPRWAACILPPIAATKPTARWKAPAG